MTLNQELTWHLGNEDITMVATLYETAMQRDVSFIQNHSLGPHLGVLYDVIHFYEPVCTSPFKDSRMVQAFNYTHAELIEAVSAVNDALTNTSR